MRRAPRVVVTANLAWNLVNFRAGLIAALVARGVAVTAVAPPDAQAEAKLAALGCDFRAIAIDGKGVSPRRDLATLVAYRRILGEIRPDAICGWTIKPNIYGTLAAWSRGIPMIANISGMGSAVIGGGTMRRLVLSLYRLALRRAHRVFFQNTADRDGFVDQGIVAVDRSAILPGSGIDTQAFAPVPLPDHADEPRPVFLMIARLLRDKGTVEFVEAARILRQRGIAVRCQLLGAVGYANPTAIGQAELDGWIASGDIEYLGTSDDVRVEVAAADCVVLPSYREGTSRVLLEAAAMARPVIATDVPGCREPIDHGRTGLLCVVRNADSLADAMATMAALSAPERSAMGAAGRAKIVAEYAQERVIDRYLDVLAPLLDQRRPA